MQQINILWQVLAEYYILALKVILVSLLVLIPLMIAHVYIENAYAITVYEDGSYRTSDNQVGCLYPAMGCTRE